MSGLETKTRKLKRFSSYTVPKQVISRRGLDKKNAREKRA